MTTYTDWLANYTEVEKKQINNMARRGYQNLTSEEQALLNRWNTDKAAFEAEATANRLDMLAQNALLHAQAISDHNHAMQVLHDLVFGSDNNEQSE